MTTSNVFKVKKLYDPNIPSNIRKSLSNFRTIGKDFDIIRQACEDLHVKYDSPGVVGATTAHFIFPRYKFGILFHKAGTGRTTPIRKTKEFALEGWQLVVMDPMTIISQTPEQIREQLRVFLTSLKTNQAKLNNKKRSTR